MNFNISIHGNTTEKNNAMMKNTGLININNPALTRPTLTHYKLRFLCMAFKCPYDRQSSCMSFNATVTSYIQVTKILKPCVEMTSPYEGHTSHPSFSRLLHRTSRLLCYTSGLPKILHWLCLTLRNDISLMGSTIRTT